jgi:hypothetical protein
MGKRTALFYETRLTFGQISRLLAVVNSVLCCLILVGKSLLLVEDPNPYGRRGGLLQGSFYEVSLALVGVASPA